MYLFRDVFPYGIHGKSYIEDRYVSFRGMLLITVRPLHIRLKYRYIFTQLRNRDNVVTYFSGFYTPINILLNSLCKETGIAGMRFGLTFLLHRDMDFLF